MAAGLSDRISFEAASRSDSPAPLSGYDLVAFFDCLHGMGDPVGGLRRAAATLAPDGTALLCSPHAIAEGGSALGTIATEADLRAVASAAGLSRFRLATATPFNRIFEARR